jgi:4-carboxymuconolactone decarboxylase
MPRINIPAFSEMSPDQQRVHGEIAAGKRGRVAGPLLVWLKSPEFANCAQKLGEFVRYETSLSPRLSELSMLITARFWTAQYEWFAHKKEALKAGVDPAAIEEIAQRRTPRFEKQDERAVYDFSMSLHKTHAVPDNQYRALVEAVGEEGAVELVGLLGYYTMISMTLNAFEVELPEGFQPELEP